jgi:hypothetical protein
MKNQTGVEFDGTSFDINQESTLEFAESVERECRKMDIIKGVDLSGIVHGASEKLLTGLDQISKEEIYKAAAALMLLAELKA